MMIEATPIPSSDQDIEPSRQSTRHARSCAKRGAIPDAAGAVIAEKGFDRATIRERVRMRELISNWSRPDMENYPMTKWIFES